MILRLFERLIALMTDLSLPAHPVTPSQPAPPPQPDGRVFAWVRTRGATTRPAQPVIIRDQSVGPRLELVGDVHLMAPHEYHWDIDELALRYPVPAIKPEA